MAMMRIEINTDWLSSLSVRPEDICAVEVRAGDALVCRGSVVRFDRPAAAIVDRLNGNHCTMIRQVLECTSGEWGQDWIDPDPACRAWARANNCPRVTVPGGIPPLTPEGIVAVPDFRMSGTNWYMVPESAGPLLADHVRWHCLGAVEMEGMESETDL